MDEPPPHIWGMHIVPVSLEPPAVAELKRVYVRPEGRGHGVGEARARRGRGAPYHERHGRVYVFFERVLD